MSVRDKNELLFSSINFNDLPSWQKRGTGLYWETYAKEATNPRTGGTVQAQRRRIKRDLELPMKGEYSNFVARLLSDSAA